MGIVNSSEYLHTLVNPVSVEPGPSLVLWYCSFGQCSLIINVEMIIAYSNEYLHTSID